MLRELTSASLEPLAQHALLRRYDDGATLLDDEALGPEQPLRVIVQGRTSWSSSRARDKTGAWLMMPGSLFGLDSVAAWARRNHVDTWWPSELPRVTCKTLGPVWMLELAPEHYAAVFGAGNTPLCRTLLRMFPTQVVAPELITALRQLDHFARVHTSALHRMLERAPCRTWGPTIEADLAMVVEPNIEAAQLHVELVGDTDPRYGRSRGRALYYVLEGRLEVPTELGTETLRIGDLGGPSPFARDDVQVAAAWTTSQCRAIVVYASLVDDMIRSDPSFARSLGPRVLP
jgi:hypothetical protein